ncbi:MAG: lamin tail domain-containing protein [Chloroflexi bacterium]|nr:MAG: lamin tail domain-containing protein [Chloroflexota bacterium]
MDPKRRQLLSYLLLNIVVSACVTVAVMFIYDHYFRSSPEPLLDVSQVNSGGTAKVEIVTIVGAGIASTETALLRNTGDAPAALKGWKLQDEESNLYLFPDVTITPGGSIQLHTAPGDDTLIDLYWGLTAPAWRSGETASLLDPAGTVKSVYKVP